MGLNGWLRSLLRKQPGASGAATRRHPRALFLRVRSNPVSAWLSAALGALSVIALVALSVVGSASAVTATPAQFSALAGLPYSGSVATFTDNVAGTSGGDGSPGGFSCVGSHTFSATIDWGDNSKSDGSVVNTGGGGHSADCTYSVSGRHTYASGTSGPEQVSVTVHASDTTSTINSAANVSPPSGSPTRLRDIPANTAEPDNGQVYAIARGPGNLIYLGGSFSSIAGAARPYLAAVNAQTGQVDTSFNPPSPDGPVRALALSSDKSRLYVGGQFTNVGQGAHLAALSASDGSVVANWNPGTPGVVYALAVGGSPETLYSGGAPGSSGSQVNAFNTSDGTARQGFNASMQGRVYALALSSAGLYIGGDMNTVDGNSAISYIAGLDPTTGGVLAGWQDPGLDGPVLSLATDATKLYAGGSFATAGAGTTIRHGLAAFAPATGALDTSFDPMADDTVTALVAADGRVWAGGDFTAVGGAARQHVAELAPSSGDADPSWDPGVSAANSSAATVSAIAAAGQDVYVGGLFSSAGGLPASDFAAFTVAPENYAAPAISGTPQEGHTLTCPDTGSWTNSPTGFSTHWLRDGSDVATAPGYTLGSGDVGSQIACEIVAMNAEGSGTAVSAPTAPVTAAPDTTAPTIDLAIPSDGAHYNQGTVVKAGYACFDETGGSGVAACDGSVASGSAIDTSSPGARSFAVTARDNAGNQATKTVHYTVDAAAPPADRTPPTIALQSPRGHARYRRGRRVHASYACEDGAGGSGIASCIGTVPDGHAIDTGQLGKHSFSLIARDKAGNITSVVITYTVIKHHHRHH